MSIQEILSFVWQSIRISLSGTSQIFFIKYNKNSFQSVFNADPMPVWCCQYAVAENWRFAFGWVEIFWNNSGIWVHSMCIEYNLEGSGNNTFTSHKRIQFPKTIRTSSMTIFDIEMFWFFIINHHLTSQFSATP